MTKKAKRKTLTPFLDEVDRRKRMFLPDLEGMPAMSPFDEHFIDVAEKHGIDLMDWEGDEEEPT